MLILARRSLVTVFKDIRQGENAFNHFKASYRPANGLYGFIEKWSKECQEIDRKWTIKSWKWKEKRTEQEKRKWREYKNKGRNKA